MHLCFHNLLALAELHQLQCELVIVEWNPPERKPKIKDSITWPTSNKFCTVRIIEVSNLIHSRYQHSSTLPLYQFIAKNAGIRRSRGSMILCTNIDILFSSELFSFLAGGNLKYGRIYRTDRYDTDANISLDWGMKRQLESDSI